MSSSSSSSSSSNQQVADPAINISFAELAPLSVPVPPISGLEFVQGDAIRFDQLAQQNIVLVVFLLNTQHDECLDSLEHLNYLHAEYARHGDFVMLAIFKESRQAVQQFCAKFADRLPFRVAIDAGQRDEFTTDKLRQAVDIAYEHPVAFVIGKDAKIKWAGKPRKPGLEVALKELLGPPEQQRGSGPPQTWSDEILKHLSVGELKKILFEADVHDIHGVVEKQELIDMIHSLPPKAA